MPPHTGTTAEKVIAAMELIPLAHKDELGQDIFRLTVRELLAAGSSAADAYALAVQTAARADGSFQPRCDRTGLLALDAIEDPP